MRRAQGRKAKIQLADETIVARVGELVGEEIRVVLPDRSGPVVRAIPLSEIRHAVVEVEFAKPNARELELAGGLPDGRAAAGEIAEVVGDGRDEEDEEDVNETRLDK